MGTIIIAGLGPGTSDDVTPAVQRALASADAVVGYKYYFQFVEPYLKAGCQCIDTGMKRERDRAEQAFRLAEDGQTVVVISSGDAGIYGMAPLIYEMQQQCRTANDDCVSTPHPTVDVQVLPGISAFQKAASLLGAPVGHDVCLISLSDLMTPWDVI
jgi:precorrin-3B C17-methyltransferase